MGDTYATTDTAGCTLTLYDDDCDTAQLVAFLGCETQGHLIRPTSKAGSNQFVARTRGVCTRCRKPFVRRVNWLGRSDGAWEAES